MVTVVIGTAGADWVTGETGVTAAANGVVAAAHSEQGITLVEVMVIVEIEGAWRTEVVPAATMVWPMEQEE